MVLGGNTVALLGIEDTEIVALDASPKMLEVAKSRLQDVYLNSPLSPPRLHFSVVDLIQVLRIAFNLPSDADAIVSTLVIEHIPCDALLQARYAQILKTRRRPTP